MVGRNVWVTITSSTHAGPQPQSRPVDGLGELRFTAEPRAFGLGEDTAVVGAFEDPVALVHVPTRAALNPSTR
jgi:hypothetical protein